MQAYDKAKELARAIKQSIEYKNLKVAHEKVKKDKKSVAMIIEFRKKQYQIQSDQRIGKKVDQREIEQLERQYQALIKNSDIANYLESEMVFSRIMGDIYRTLGEAIDIDMTFSGKK